MRAAPASLMPDERASAGVIEVTHAGMGARDVVLLDATRDIWLLKSG
jgi:hypothetical protein